MFSDLISDLFSDPLGSFLGGFLIYYNNKLPHEALGNQAPLKYGLQKLA